MRKWNDNDMDSVARTRYFQERQREKELGLVPLRINSSTVVLVPPEKRTKAHAEEYAARIAFRPSTRGASNKARNAMPQDGAAAQEKKEDEKL